MGLSPSSIPIPPRVSLSPPAQALGKGMDALGFSWVLGVEDEEAVEVAVTHVSHHGAYGAVGQAGCGVEDSSPLTTTPAQGGCGPTDR